MSPLSIVLHLLCFEAAHAFKLISFENGQCFFYTEMGARHFVNEAAHRVVNIIKNHIRLATAFFIK